MTTPAVPPLPRPGLRERKKAATMRQVQDTALDLQAYADDVRAAGGEILTSAEVRDLERREGRSLI